MAYSPMNMQILQGVCTALPCHHVGCEPVADSCTSSEILRVIYQIRPRASTSTDFPLDRSSRRFHERGKLTSDRPLCGALSSCDVDT